MDSKAKITLSILIGAICLVSLLSVYLVVGAELKIQTQNLTSVQLNTTQFGGKLVEVIEIDSNYPCYLQSNGESICPIIESDKLDDLKIKLKEDLKEDEIKEAKEDKEKELKEDELDKLKDKLVDSKISKGIPIIDYRKAKYKVNGTETWTDEEGKEWKIDSLVQDGYETTYLDMNVENTYQIDTTLNGIVHIGFSSTVYKISDYNFGSSENVTAKSYGVCLENTHASSDSDMVLWLKMTDDATDSSGNGNDGTVHNAVHNFSWYEFDGVNDYIGCGNDNSLNITENMTVGSWVKLDNLNHWQDILEKDNNIWRMQVSSTGNSFFVRVYNQSQYFNIDSGYSLSINQWYYLLFTVDNSNVRLYVNGVSVKNNTFTGPMPGVEGVLKIGDVDGDKRFNGSIDEVIIYNRSLNSTEITALYNKGLYRQLGNYTSGILDAGQDVNWTNINWTFSNTTAKQNVSLYARTGEIAKPDFADASLVSMWSLNQTDTNATKTLAIDAMGRNNGTTNGGMTIGEADGVFQGENGTSFDGSNDYITTGFNNIPVSLPFSIAGWIKSTDTSDQAIIVVSDFSASDKYYKLGFGTSAGFTLRNGTSQTLTGTNVADGKWHYVVATASGTNDAVNMTLYVDETFTNRVDGKLPSGLDKCSIGVLARNSGYTTDLLNGSLAYVSIFNKSLTQDEIINWSTYTGQLLQSSGETLDLPVNRYLQYKAKLETNTSETPVLTDVQAEYGGTAPNVTINSPLNQNYTTTTITFNVTAIDDTEMSSCTYSLDGASNISMTNSTTSEWNATNSSMTQGSHTVNFYCKDISNNLNNTESVTFFIDTIAPIITINNPSEGEEEGSDTITLSITTNEICSCNYSLDSGTNTSMTTSDNLTFTKSLKLIYGSYSVDFYCTDLVNYSNSTSVNFVMVSQGQGEEDSSGGSSYSPEPSVIYVGENKTFSEINLESIEIQNKKLCIGNDKLRFKSLDNEKGFTLLDSVKLFINNTKKSNKLFLDQTNEEYYYNLENLEKGEIEVKIIAEQNGKILEEIKTLKIERCLTLQELSENNLSKLMDFIKENKIIFIYLSILLVILILASYLSYNYNNKKNL